MSVNGKNQYAEDSAKIFSNILQKTTLSYFQLADSVVHNQASDFLPSINLQYVSDIPTDASIVFSYDSFQSMAWDGRHWQYNSFCRKDC